jgi:hypothetical protein
MVGRGYHIASQGYALFHGVAADEKAIAPEEQHLNKATRGLRREPPKETRTTGRTQARRGRAGTSLRDPTHTYTHTITTIHSREIVVPGSRMLARC